MTKKIDCMELHNCQRYIKNNCRKHAYLHFAVPRRQYLRCQSNGNCDELDECMARGFFHEQKMLTSSAFKTVLDHCSYLKSKNAIKFQIVCSLSKIYEMIIATS